MSSGLDAVYLSLCLRFRFTETYWYTGPAAQCPVLLSRARNHLPAMLATTSLQRQLRKRSATTWSSSTTRYICPWCATSCVSSVLPLILGRCVARRQVAPFVATERVVITKRLIYVCTFFCWNFEESRGAFAANRICTGWRVAARNSRTFAENVSWRPRCVDEPVGVFLGGLLLFFVGGLAIAISLRTV